MTAETIVVVSKKVVSCDLAEGAAILSLIDSQYYGLDAVGTYIWRLLEQPTPVGAVSDAILRDFDVDSAHGERDVTAFLEQLHAAGLIEVVP